jgi:hypothetical protein
MESRTYFLFAGLNLSWAVIVFFFYAETAGRLLEFVEAMFSSRSPFYKSMEKAYHAAGGNSHAGVRHNAHAGDAKK